MYGVLPSENCRRSFRHKELPGSMSPEGGNLYRCNAMVEASDTMWSRDSFVERASEACQHPLRMSTVFFLAQHIRRQNSGVTVGVTLKQSRAEQRKIADLPVGLDTRFRNRTTNCALAPKMGIRSFRQTCRRRNTWFAPKKVCCFPPDICTPELRIVGIGADQMFKK
jgi:hypothetical protein